MFKGFFINESNGMSQLLPFSRSSELTGGRQSISLSRNDWTERRGCANDSTHITRVHSFQFMTPGCKILPKKKAEGPNLWHDWPLAWNTRSSMGFKQCIYFYLGIIPLKTAKQWKNPGSQKSWNASYRLDGGNLSRWLTEGRFPE